MKSYLNCSILKIKIFESFFKKNTLQTLLMDMLQMPEGWEPLQGNCLLIAMKSPGIPGTHLINLGRMKSLEELGATKWFQATP